MGLTSRICSQKLLVCKEVVIMGIENKERIKLPDFTAKDKSSLAVLDEEEVLEPIVCSADFSKGCIHQ